MGIWDTLGISVTTDVSTIKKAFAAKSKIYHPEEHPEEFKRLRRAYKDAIKYAKNNGGNGNNQDGQQETYEQTDSKYVSVEINNDSQKVVVEEQTANTEDQEKQTVETEVPRQPYADADAMRQPTVETEVPRQQEVKQEKTKTLFERLHGESPNVTQEKSVPEKKQKSLFERLHGEKPVTAHEEVYREEKPETTYEEVYREEKPKTLYERMHSNEEEEQDSEDFNFDDIINENVVERLLYEVRIIFHNPFLRNNPFFWEYYITNNWSSALIKNSNFIDRLIEEMCNHQGWFEVTLKKLEEKLKTSLDKVRENKVKIQVMATDYERGYDRYILTQVGKNGFDMNLDNDESIRCYLSIYLKLVEEKKIQF